ncbi:MAG: hypothetical protein A2725_03905 [Candidatus Magasanikbacteria bacterium RIFCSPHIGHO2_01_FULL_33_34]|uniref:50S ribosomal protein L7/L12 n=1 Tax=Candidatus Magasanikbacteria bacterium RIFCSPHIGHO2_01_FULL_33_34 TaxID=1798671 RepID=A0A1F6LHT9_9BACT|nr:MAG: hypothetical protein A2725_03905 [Candidatus Magasanikbacteria bacterium RIFCSPHIGHO2_01_FULL_33_34]OGH65113.1 MAG: hypothetical protein A3B83_03665 [Candidatus Magasanikbacteria bacterium RIFCSPHIGHO2_02_FULL_33_17]OGH75343.1 MAG: hypothetical protein A3A89_04500 [Candidatus Magasanikbacteria bacterium RIFCSPLOWO2_01_FULL_33_34]OGH81274.1 MAG: hypothetical protein A3F93_04590 [Candidatus Magasanikbacteria bacterium RIFCSPLOWO2_12_FULL_34_7]
MDSITDLINNKADEIFPTQTLSPINHSTTSDDKIDNQLDLEDYNEIEENYDQKENKNEIIIDKIVADEKPSEKSTQTQSNTENIPIDLEKLKSKIYSIKDQLDAIIRIIEGNEIILNIKTTKEINPPNQKIIQSDDRIINGIFDGIKMIDKNNKEYSIPPNYASKSKLVEGDELKLTILENGKFIYKQVKPIERIRKIGILTKDPNNEQWCVTENNNKYMILTASVTFYKGKPGDEVIFIVAKDIPNSWAAVDNIIRKNI